MSRIKHLFAGSSFSGEIATGEKLLLALLTSLLLIAGVKSNSGESASMKISPAHAIARSSCSNTLYPELCYSAIADSLDDEKKVQSSKDVIILSLNAAITAAGKNYAALGKLFGSGNSNLTKREKAAVHDCLETLDETLDELHTAIKDLNEYPFKKSLEEHADDLKTLLSSAITNQVVIITLKINLNILFVFLTILYY